MSTRQCEGSIVKHVIGSESTISRYGSDLRLPKPLHLYSVRWVASITLQHQNEVMGQGCEKGKSRIMCLCLFGVLPFSFAFLPFPHTRHNWNPQLFDDKNVCLLHSRGGVRSGRCPLGAALVRRCSLRPTCGLCATCANVTK